MMIPGFSRYLQAVRKLPGIISLFSLLLWSSTGVSQAQPLVEPIYLPLIIHQTRPYYAAVNGLNGNTRSIFLYGQTLGNHADIFSKIGDSITADDDFLYPIGDGNYHLRDYGELAPVVAYYSQSAAREGRNSFSNFSLAAHSGWTTGYILNQSYANKAVCGEMESPLACEYRMVRPSIALIMLGTNDVYLHVPMAEYEANLRTILQLTLDAGIIPVLSTLPPMMIDWTVEPIQQANALLKALAEEYNIPLWDYNALLLPLPNYGLSSDGIHPDNLPGGAADFTPENLQYGMTVRNLSALYILQAVKGVANPEGQLQDEAAPIPDENQFPYPYPDERDLWKSQPY